MNIKCDGSLVWGQCECHRIREEVEEVEEVEETHKVYLLFEEEFCCYENYKNLDLEGVYASCVDATSVINRMLTASRWNNWEQDYNLAGTQIIKFSRTSRDKRDGSRWPKKVTRSLIIEEWEVQ